MNLGTDYHDLPRPRSYPRASVGLSAPLRAHNPAIFAALGDIQSAVDALGLDVERLLVASDLDPVQGDYLQPPAWFSQGCCAPRGLPERAGASPFRGQYPAYCDDPTCGRCFSY
jgi:hypothetical protein